MAEAALPPLFQRWITEALGAPPPVERRATCLTCVQCIPDRPEPVAFSQSSKCCTYVPHLPNFLLGALLADADPRLAFGQETARARIRRGVGVSPLGLLIASEDFETYERIVAAGQFGRSSELRCPHYIEEGGLCGVWLHRNAICSTWYCRHDAGKQGRAFWRAVETLLRAAEAVVERHVALRLRFGFPKDEAKAIASLEAGIFGPWAADLEGYYRKCAERASTLAWADVVRLDPAGLAPLVAATRRAHERLRVPTPQPETAVVFNPNKVLDVPEDAGGVWVTGYHPHSATRLSRGQFDLLMAFRAGTVGDLLAAAAAASVRFAPALQERLMAEDLLLVPAFELALEDEGE